MSQHSNSSITKAGRGSTNISADEALRRLVAGNARFASGELRLSGINREVLFALANGQHPYATILGCSDSRVPPEIIFDTGLGDLFVIRVAGNVFSAEVAGSLQYAGAHLGTPLFVVLGHEDCGAVKGALKTRDDGEVQTFAHSDPGRKHPALAAAIRWTAFSGGAANSGSRK